MPDKPLVTAKQKASMPYLLPSRKASVLAVDKGKEPSSVGEMLAMILAKHGIKGDACNLFALFEVVGIEDLSEPPASPEQESFGKCA